MPVSYFVTSSRKLPTVWVLENTFDTVEGDWTKSVTLEQIVRASVVTLKQAPGAIAKLPAASRKTVIKATGKATTTLAVLDKLARALNGQLFSKDGKPLTLKPPAKPPQQTPRKQPVVIDVSIPPAVKAAFAGKFLPVVVGRRRISLALPKVVAQLSTTQRKRSAYSPVARLEGAVGDVALRHVGDAQIYAAELQQVGVKRAAEMVRFIPKYWHREPSAADAEVALGIACALARSGRGVIYARPGGRRLETDGDESVAVAFDFTSSDAVAIAIAR